MNSKTISVSCVCLMKTVKTRDRILHGWPLKEAVYTLLGLVTFSKTTDVPISQSWTNFALSFRLCLMHQPKVLVRRTFLRSVRCCMKDSKLEPKLVTTTHTGNRSHSERVIGKHQNYSQASYGQSAANMSLLSRRNSQKCKHIRKHIRKQTIRKNYFPKIPFSIKADLSQ